MKKLLLLLLLSLGLIVNSSAEDQQSNYKDTLNAEIQALEASLEQVESQAREAKEKAKMAELITKEAEEKAEEIAKKAASLNEEIKVKKLEFKIYQENIPTVISIDKDGNYYINSIIDSGNEGTNNIEPESLNVVKNRVMARIEIFPNMQIFIRADKNVAYGKVFAVIALLQNAGVEKVGFSFEKVDFAETYSIDDEIIEAERKRIAELAATIEAITIDDEIIEAEKQRIAEQEALKAKAKKVMAEVQRKAEEAKAKAKLTEEEKELLNKLKTAYVNNIAARVKSYWNYQDAVDGWSCQVFVLQDIDGNVQAVDTQSCNLDDSSKAKSFRDSIERAVYKASPLPAAPDVAVFNNEILFTFTAN